MSQASVCTLPGHPRLVRAALRLRLQHRVTQLACETLLHQSNLRLETVEPPAALLSSMAANRAAMFPLRRIAVNELPRARHNRGKHVRRGGRAGVLEEADVVAQPRTKPPLPVVSKRGLS